MLLRRDRADVRKDIRTEEPADAMTDSGLFRAAEG
jgi:hypothetical protein